MLRQLKRLIRRMLVMTLGENIFIFYHKMLAHLASVFYGNPSKKMLVIAVTGTKGKTSTLNFIWHVLTSGGYKVGLVSTANIRIGNEEILNWYHMTMPGRFLLQKLLRKMYKSRCDIVLVEATSEGIKMGRHIGLYYDIAVFTNLFPEHLKSHSNSFELYRNTKGKLFENLTKLPTKRWNGEDLQKIIIANLDDENGHYFYQFDADKKYSFGEKNGDYKFEGLQLSPSGTKFTLLDEVYEFPLLGKFNVYNALPAILIGQQLSIDLGKIKAGLKNCSVIPGRMEVINEGQNFTVIVDYAHEGVSMRRALEACEVAKKTKENKIIAVYGAEGGGRDITKRETMSKAVSEIADFAVVTLSDPFDTDPEIINKDIVNWLKKFGMKYGGPDADVFDFVDRRQAIKKALSLAKPGDVVLFASKGAEQSIIFSDHTEKWDDREEVRLALLSMQQI